MTDKPVRILIVEDETIVALDLKSSLTLLGYSVVGTASSGEEAIAKANETHPDLALMDIILKGEMDGVQAAEAIRSQLDIPVIFLTACADESTLERAKVTEPFGYLLKPFEERELHGHIEVALYKHRIEKKLRESEERYSLATQGANDGLWDWNLENQEIYFSPRWWSMLGYIDEQIGSRPEDWFKKLHPGDRDQVQSRLADHLDGATSHFESEYRILDAEGTYRWVLCRGLALRNGQGKAYRIAGSQTDITDRKVYNPLTGLPNRILLIDRLERALKRIKSHEESAFAVLSLDVDGRKAINDSLGYVVADQLLVQVARRVQKCLTAQDTVAHCGNDEFVLLLDEVRDAHDATLIASNLHAEMEQPFQLDGHSVYITATTGIAMGTKGYNYPEELLRDASTAMHRAKVAGKGRCEIFDGDMRSTAIARLKLEADLRRAFDQREFLVYYQPIVCLKTGKLTGFEALVRWQRPSGLALPNDFLSLAESIDLIIPLERWVLMETCSQMARWQQQSESLLNVNVNICPKHYSSPDLVRVLKEVLETSGMDARSLRLEITESTLMESTETISETLAQIENMNIQVHMDDFGTGYSSLSYLHRFPIYTLKIDRSFVAKLGLSEETWKIVQAIVNLARNLGMEVIAEGIENLMQMRMLQSIGCEFGQGYYFAKPMDVRSVDSLLSMPLPWSVAFERSSTRAFPFAVHPAQPRIVAFDRNTGSGI
jgi:diguanylate cyclase (GGDEF)-like protein/PAS domain S-box-containing protein